MGKFKVGDRVRVTNSAYAGLNDFLQNGQFGVISEVYREDILAVKMDNDPEKYAYTFFSDAIESAPLFAVGDKVRFKGSGACNAQPGATAVVTKKCNGEFVWVKWDRNHLSAGQMDGGYEPYHFEHATTDGEGFGPTVNEIRDFCGLPPLASSTTGFTIPTDEEALPPKIGETRTFKAANFKIEFGPDPKFPPLFIHEKVGAAAKFTVPKYPFIFSGGVLKLSDANTYKPRPAIVALVTNGQPLPADKPKVHKTTTKATKEANRLATLYPGQEFGVFELVSKRVATVDIREAA